MTSLNEETRKAVLKAEQHEQDILINPDESAADSSGHFKIDHCLVCYGDLQYTAITACQHNEICGICHLRLRYLHNDFKCPICKMELAQIVVDSTETAKASFDEYPIWGNELGADFVYRQDVGMFFRKGYYEQEIQPLFGYHCTVKNCHYDGTTSMSSSKVNESSSSSSSTLGGGNNNNNNNNNNKQTTKTPLRNLQDHLRIKHRLSLCQLCVDHHRDFVARLPRYTPSQLQKHFKQGDADTGCQGHPVCEFCRPTRFYDITALHSHLAKEHYKCHICEQHLNLPNQYFKHYPSLEKHFDRKHFLCHDVQCLTARFVVFANEIDLRAHERSVHGGTSTGNSKVQLEFRVRRNTPIADSHLLGQEAPSESDFNYGLDGTAFVPADLPTARTSDTVTLHPLHVQRTRELQQQAQAIRQEESRNQNEEASFPSLQESQTGTTSAAGGGGCSSTEHALRIGWATGATMQRIGRRQAGAVTDEDFPTLPATSQPKKKSNTGSMSNATRKLQAPSRQLAAMNVAANAAANAGSQPNAEGGWGKVAGSSPAVASTAAAAAAGPGMQAFLPSSAAQTVTRNSNNASNLSADNFPSLASVSSSATASSQSHRYTAAEAFARKSQPQQAKEPPSWNSVTDFPPPMSSRSHGNNVSTRARMLGSAGPTPSQAAAANVLQLGRIKVDNTVTVDEMKSTLGSVQYKKLKNYTKDFAADSLDPDAYVDHAASLFDRGYADADFWRFLPSLIQSCPNETSSQQAMQYLESLRRMRNGAANAESSSVARTHLQQLQQPVQTATSSWSSSLSGHHIAPTPAAAVAMAPPTGMRFVPPPPPPPPAGARITPNKKKSAWGSSGGPSPVVVAKAAPGSVVVAAASIEPSTGTATKFMAKEQKQQAAAVGGKSKNKKKKKQNNELRALAFGK